MKSILKAAAIAVCLLPHVAAADIAEDVTDYMGFITYEDGIIVPEQLGEDVFSSVTFIDTRNAEQFAQDTIAGAINIEWREIPERIDELPEDGMVVLFCNTGTLSAQAVFAARLMGHDNVLVLQTGIIGWKQNAAYKPDL
jgi:rhodanese-related sulfurtransferase